MSWRRALGGVAGACSVALAAALFVFGAPWSGLALATPAPALATGRRWLALAAPLAVPVAPVEYVLRVNQLGGRLDGDGLSTRDRLGVWLLNLGMAGGGALVGFPEAALETTLLAVPDPDGVRTFRSAFPRGSTAVAGTLAGWKRACAGGARTFGPTRIRFGKGGGHAEWRRALALDPVTLTAVAGDGCALDVTAAVPVDYPPGAFLELVDTPIGPLGVDEGLYDALERDGWLFPYEARWRWTEGP